MYKTIYLFVAIFVTSCLAFWQQSVGVKGILMCNDKPLINAKIKLWDKDKTGY